MKDNSYFDTFLHLNENEDYLLKIKQKSSFDRLCYWITERTKIRKKKDAGKKFPWTKDPILQKFKFTNPSRYDDAVSKYIFENVFSKIKNEELLLYNVFIHRSFSKMNSSKKLGIVKNNNINNLSELNKEEPLFTGAFMRCININEMIKSIKYVWDHRKKILKSIKKENTLENCYKEISKVRHIGSFMSWQITADLYKTPILKNAKDSNKYVHLGPGALNGLKELKESSNVENLIELCEKINKKIKTSNIKIDLVDLEHSLCEFYKYSRCLKGGSKPKQLFKINEQFLIKYKK